MPDFSQYRLLPLEAIRSRVDPRDYRLTYAPKAVSDLPSEVDLDALGTVQDIEDQGQEGSCTGQTEKKLREHLVLRAGGAKLRFSAAYIYYQARLREQSQNEDNGAQARDGLQEMVDGGICEEELMPYVAGDYATPPSVLAKQNARLHTIDRYIALGGVGELVTVLAQEERACGITTPWYREWDNPQNGVACPVPNRQPDGGHMMCVCGYAYRQNPYTNMYECMVRCHNSWSPQYADAGHIWFPYMTFDQVVFERWTAYADSVTPGPTPTPTPTPTPVPNGITQAILDQAALVAAQSAALARLLGLPA